MDNAYNDDSAYPFEKSYGHEFCFKTGLAGPTPNADTLANTIPFAEFFEACAGDTTPQIVTILPDKYFGCSCPPNTYVLDIFTGVATNPVCTKECPSTKMDVATLFCIPDILPINSSFGATASDCVNGGGTCKTFGLNTTSFYIKGVACDPKTSYIDYSTASPLDCKAFTSTAVTGTTPSDVVSNAKFELS